MKHIEVKVLRENLRDLIEHLIAQGNNSFYINYALDRNLKKLDTAIAEIDSHIDLRLRELDQKAYEFNHEDFAAGLLLLTPEEQEERKILYAKFLEDMEGENDFQLFKINPDKCEDLKIDFRYMSIISMFFYE
jgi:hypothetical protein